MNYFYRESVTLGPGPVDYSTTYADCAAAKAAGNTVSGVYYIDLSLSEDAAGTTSARVGSTSIKVYCEMSLNGGGWMLLTTATSATADYSGAVVPWANSKFPQNPSRSSAYSRDWSSTGFGLLPVAGDQIMIARNSNDDYAYMTLSLWCAGAAWSASGSDPTCGGTGGHPGFGYGNFFVGSSTTATTSHYLNGCALTGGCNTGGVDGIGFSTLNGWANSAHSCYGGCYSGSANGDFYWGTTTAITEGTEQMNYFFKRAE